MIEFKMPALGADMDEGTLDEWLIKPGDKVTRGQIVAVVETTKAAVEIECWQEGTVGELMVPVGETVQVGTVLATLLAEGERAEPRPAARPRRSRKAAAKPTALPAPAKVLVTAFVAVKSPNASALPNIVTISMLLLSDMTSICPQIATVLSRVSNSPV